MAKSKLQLQQEKDEGLLKLALLTCLAVFGIFTIFVFHIAY